MHEMKTSCPSDIILSLIDKNYVHHMVHLVQQ